MVSLIRDQLNEYLYDANLADLKLNVGNRSNGIDVSVCKYILNDYSNISLEQVSIRGYDDKQVILLEKLLCHLFDFKANEKRFDILKEEYHRNLKNFSAEQPYQHSIYFLTLLLTENVWSNSELLDAIECMYCSITHTLLHATYTFYLNSGHI